MGIRKTIAAVITAAMVLSMTACTNNEKPSENGSGTIQTDGNSSNKELDIGNAIPEISITDVSAFTYKYDSELEGMVVTDYLRESPKVRIPDKFEGEPVVKVNFSKLEKELTQLVMPNSVKDFELSSKIKRSLQYVNIPNSVTKIGSSAFSGCTGLTSITIPDSVTEIGYEAFFHCTGLASVTIPDSVTWIGVEAFYDCTGLTSITIPDSVTGIDNSAFRGCTNLTSATIPDSVTEIGERAFEGCKSLTGITIPNSVTKIGNKVFRDCTNIKITYKDKTYDYEHIDDYLYDAVNLGESGMLIEDGVLKVVSRELTEVVIPDSVTSISNDAFKGCKWLTSITIGNGVTRISDGIFSDCTNLTSVTIPDSVTQINRNVFDDCTNIKVTYKGKIYNYEHLNDWLFDAVNFDKNDMLIENGILIGVSKKLTTVVIPNGVTEISEKAFAGCTGLTSITIPDSVTTIGSEAFKDCTSLSNVIIPDSVIEMYSSAFDGCTNSIQVTYKGELCRYEQINGGIQNGQLRIVIMKDVVNEYGDAVKRQLEADGFNVVISMQESNDVVKGYVIRTSPAAQELVERGSSITLAISIGAKTDPVTVTVPVPNLVGIPEYEALVLCEELHLDAHIVYTEEKTDYVRGCVISQSIEVGTLVERGTVITLTVSA